MDEFERLINEGNEAYKKDDYNKAVICYEDALKLATDENKFRFKSILPMMGRCYRQIGNPSSVIELATEVKQEFGREFITSVFLTTVAAAYADMREYGKAHICVNEAIRLENGKISGPLQAVIDRLEK
jgi:tetratricopeptide (TPR) repeat protein